MLVLDNLTQEQKSAELMSLSECQQLVPCPGHGKHILRFHQGLAGEIALGLLRAIVHGSSPFACILQPWKLGEKPMSEGEHLAVRGPHG